MAQEKKINKLADLTAKIEKQFGKGSVFTENMELPKLERLPCAVKKLNKIVGGGLPYGRIIELFGQESVGKTTIALLYAAAAQAKGEVVMMVDAEHAFNPEWAIKLGVNVDKLVVSQPDCGEDALTITEMAIESGAVDFIIVDSVAALVPKAELEGDMGDNKMGLHAKLMSQAMRKLTAKINKAKCVVIMINQMREKIGVMFGNPNVTTGGNALKFYASIRLEISKGKAYENNGIPYGNPIRVKAQKNKTAPPFQKCEFDLDYEYGYLPLKDTVLEAIEKGILVLKGAYISYNGTTLGQGMPKTLELLNDNPELVEEIESKL